ncbi:MAG: hypothetical protein ACXAD7_13525 [Candidatus Kariarchaeaceae archaeon]
MTKLRFGVILVLLFTLTPVGSTQSVPIHTNWEEGIFITYAVTYSVSYMTENWKWMEINSTLNMEEINTCPDIRITNGLLTTTYECYMENKLKINT